MDTSRLAGWWASVPVWAVFGVCCGLPLLWIVLALVLTPEGLSALGPVGFHLRLLGRTLLYNGAVAVLACVIAIPVAIVIGRGRGVFATVLTFVLPAALLLPSVTYAYGWMQVLRIVAQWLAPLKGSPEFSVYPMPGSGADVMRCVWTLATWLWPIPAGVIGLSLRRLDPDLQQQALLDGAYRRVVGRRLLAPAAASLAVVAILAMQEFAVYEPTGISVVATEVRTVFETGQFSSTLNPIAAVETGQGADFPLSDQRTNAAAALATALPLLFVVAILAVVALILMNRDDTGDSAASQSALPRVLWAGGVSKAFALGVILLTVAVPFGAMIVSIRRAPDLGRIWSTFSNPVLGTIAIALCAGVIGAALAACGVVRRMNWPVALGLATFLVGGQMLAIAMVRLYNRPGFASGLAYHWIYNGPAIVVMAFVARFGWLAMLASRSTWGAGYRELREMAAVDGAGAVAAARLVIWPLAWPIVLASGVLLVLLSMTEVPATVLLNPLRPPMFIPQLMVWLHTVRYDDMLEGSLLLAVVVSVLAVTVVAFVRLALKWRAPLKRATGVAVACAVAIHLIGCTDGGQPDEVWLETGAGKGQVVYPRAITYSKSDDTYYIVDRLARIQHLDRHGKHVGGWRMPQHANGKPVGISLGPDGNIWVPDTHYHRVMVYKPSGELIREFGGFGKKPGQFIYPTDIAFDSRGRVFVSEYGDNDRVQVFDRASGKFLFQFGKFGNGDGEFSRPQSMVILGDTVYITDASNHRISVWTTEGRFLRNMCKIGSGDGELRFPYGLDVDSKGRLVVCEFGNNRVQLIDKQTGRGLGTWGAGGRELGQLAYPWAVAVDKDDRVVAVDAGNNRLQVFEF